MFGHLAETRTNPRFNLSQLQNWILQRSPNSNNDIEMTSSDNAPNISSNAVVVRNAVKYYGSFKVLEDLYMTVPKGTIYGLLGPSGCGKTTLLECIIGSKMLNVGEVHLLGQKLPNAKNETRIGYMPQSTALYMDLTITETLRFFGWIMDMDESQIKKRTKELIDLLMLHEEDRPIKNLSGGQQRRVSLAAAILHEPELLILDEPTVGVDSVLRQLIWNHFLSLTKNSAVTIIITTHYIEEAIQANLVGVMRSGCLMAESSPQQLLRQHQVNTLENVFLKLILVQNETHTKNNHISKHNATNNTDKIKNKWTLKKSHMKAMIWKHLIWLKINPFPIFISLLLPIIVLLLFSATFGHHPFNFPVAIVNLENQNCVNATMLCNSNELSCIFLQYLEKNQLDMKFYSTQDSAIKSVMRGQTILSVTIKRNYSIALRARARTLRLLDSPVHDDLSIDIFRDLSNKHIAVQSQLMLYKTFQNFFGDYVESCGISKKYVALPLAWEPIYEWMDPDYTDFSISGIMISITFIIGMFLTSSALVVDYEESGVERLFAMGINRLELITSHIIVEIGVLLLQTIFDMIIVFLVLNVSIKGSIFLTVALLILTGFSGICFGLCISCITTSNAAITLTAMGTYLAIVITNGILWPIEGIHWLLKPFSSFFPLTKPIESLRNILHKDWSFLKQEVYIGFLSISIWGLIFILFATIFLKYQRK